MSERPASSVPTEYVANFFGVDNADHLDLMEEIGAQWAREGTGWGGIEPEPGEFDLSSYDEDVEGIREHGLELMPLLGFPAAWPGPPEAGEHPQTHTFAPREEMVDKWQRYVERVVTRHPDVEYFEIWNEPNIRFLRGVENRKEAYVDRLLIPAAEVIHDHDRKVVAPTFTVEWPADAWPDDRRPSKVKWNVRAVTEAIDAWFDYNDAWRHVDILSVHYNKGDAEKQDLPYADNLMPFFDHVHDNYISQGKLDGIWNTEGGLTATQAGDEGEFASLEHWERPPYTQWMPRYTVPLIYWGLERGWEFRDQYKLFWYAMSLAEDDPSPLRVARLLERDEDGTVQPSDMGRAMHTLSTLLTHGERIRTYPDVEAGMGLLATSADAAPPLEFTTYGFQIDDDIVLIAWLDLPGLEMAESSVDRIQAVVPGIDEQSVQSVERIDYVSGDTTRGGDCYDVDRGLAVETPVTSDPVLYLRIER